MNFKDSFPKQFLKKASDSVLKNVSETFSIGEAEFNDRL